MRKLVYLSLLLVIGLLSLSSYAHEKSSSMKNLPLVVVFALPAEQGDSPSDPDVVAEVINQFKSSNLVDAFLFNPDLPIVSRAVLEKRLDEQTLKEISDIRKAIRVASAIGAQYAAQIRGKTSENKVNVSIQFTHTSGDSWSSVADCDISLTDGNAEVNRSNAIRTATSSAVSQVLIAAFGQEAVLDASNGLSKSLSSNSVEKRVDSQPDFERSRDKESKPRNIEAEYAELEKQIEEFSGRKDYPNVVTSIRRAIDLRPDDVNLRVRLAQTYLEMGLTKQAIDEGKRALALDEKNLAVHNMLARLYEVTDSLEEAVKEYQEIVLLNPQDVQARIKLGDLYWNAGKIDQAAAVYREAVAVAPNDAGPHERLWRLYAAQGMYQEMFQHLFQAKSLASSSTDRGEVLMSLIQEECTTIASRIERVAKEFESNQASRQNCYKDCKDILGRADALASFLSVQAVPSTVDDVYPHGVLAVSLVAQAAGCMVSYLETEKQHYLTQALLLTREAKTELALFAKRTRA